MKNVYNEDVKRLVKSIIGRGDGETVYVDWQRSVKSNAFMVKG